MPDPTLVPSDQLNVKIRPSTHSRLGRHHAHDGFLLRRRTSNLRLEGDLLRGDGSDAGVVLPGLDRGEWFSVIWGDFADDTLALQLDESVIGPLPRLPHQDVQPLGRFVDGLREYQLDQALRERLGIVLEEHDYRIGMTRAVRREVYFHDDCFWCVRPVDDAGTLRSLARQQLALHEEYLGCEGGLSAYIEPLCDLLRTGTPIKLRSTRDGSLRVILGGRPWWRGASVVWNVVPPPA